MFLFLWMLLSFVDGKWNIPSTRELTKLRASYSKETLAKLTHHIPQVLLPRTISEEHVKLRQWLGGGSSGDVFLCQFKHYSNLTAKLIKGEKNENRIQKFLREAKIQYKIGEHNHVLPMAMISYGDRHKIIVYTPYMENKCLRNYVKKMKGVNAKIHGVRIVRELVDAIHHIHSRGYAHNDIYAKNILVNHNGHIALADFGLAEEIKPQAKIRDIRMVINLVKEFEFNQTISNPVIRKSYEEAIDNCYLLQNEKYKCKTGYLKYYLRKIERLMRRA